MKECNVKFGKWILICWKPKIAGKLFFQNGDFIEGKVFSGILNFK